MIGHISTGRYQRTVSPRAGATKGTAPQATLAGERSVGAVLRLGGVDGWHLKGLGRLTAPARGAAQELAAWRERVARAADRPVRTILPDEVIVSLAERPPRSAADIPRSRLFDPRKLPPERVKELLAAAARGADLPPEEIRLPQTGCLRISRDWPG